MISFNLDSDTKSIAFSVHPKGEENPIDFNVNKYKLTNEGGKLFLEVSDIKTNREWMNIAIQNFMPKSKIPIPAEYEKLIRLVM
jgi:hypothetical protein